MCDSRLSVGFDVKFLVNNVALPIVSNYFTMPNEDVQVYSSYFAKIFIEYLHLSQSSTNSVAQASLTVTVNYFVYFSDSSYKCSGWTGVGIHFPHKDTV